MTVLSLCDKTGNIVKPWSDAGYDCLCIDLQHNIRSARRKRSILYKWGDVRSWWPEDIDDIVIVFAFPPCTHLASSGAQDFKRKGLTCLIDALQIVEGCRRICVASGAPYMIENPVGLLSTHWREPDNKFSPHEYAGYLKKPRQEAYTKKTCLWTGGGFIMPKRREIEPTRGSHMHTMNYSVDRAEKRSATPKGFSQAVFEANHPMIQERYG